MIEKLGKETVNSHLISSIYKIARIIEERGCQLKVCWIPSHREETNIYLEGNNKADELTRASNASYNFVLEKRKYLKAELKKYLRKEAKNRNLSSWPNDKLEVSRRFGLDKHAREGKNLMHLSSVKK